MGFLPIMVVAPAVMGIMLAVPVVLVPNLLDLYRRRLLAAPLEFVSLVEVVLVDLDRLVVVLILPIKPTLSPKQLHTKLSSFSGVKFVFLSLQSNKRSSPKYNVQ